MATRVFRLEQALLSDGVADDVRIIAEDGVIVDLRVGEAPASGDVELRGLALPGFANAHSHAFHRALRGRVEEDAGDFWAWRHAMYRAVERLDVDLYRRLATAAYAEMVLAGYTAVGEFHYVHHRAGGRPHDEPDAMAAALVDAARAAGIRLTLLDTIYLRGGLDAEGRSVPLSPAQRRFSDGDADGWLARHRLLREGPLVRVGAAVHSVRAVDVRDLAGIVPGLVGAPVHAHVSEQRAENAQARAAYGRTPVGVFAEAGLLGPHFTAVHATHLTPDDVSMLATSDSIACFCPTTERDLADGIGPARALREAGVRIAIGSDQHVVVDPFDELRALEGHERLASGARGTFTAADLLRAGTENGYSSLGWRGGRIEVGSACDLVTIDPRGVRTAGALRERAWLAASAADVEDVVVAGERVVRGGRHRLGEVGRLLDSAIRDVFDGAVPPDGAGVDLVGRGD